MSLIVFSHANSFPAGTYGVLFKKLRSRGFTMEKPVATAAAIEAALLNLGAG